MQRERPVIAEAIERPPARYPAHQRAVLALVEESARLLPVPGRREIAHSILLDFDLARNLAVQRLDVAGEAFASTDRDVVARKNPGGRDERNERVNDLSAILLEPRAEQLNDE